MRRVAQTIFGTVYLRLRGVHLAGLARVERRPKVSGGRNINIGGRVQLGGPLFAVQLAARGQGRIDIGDRVLLNHGVVIAAEDLVEIGHDTLIGDLCSVFDTNFHPVQPGGPVTCRPVHIGSNVWLGRLVTVLPGAVIGDGAVVAAGSVVRDSIPPWSVAAGNPARVVSHLSPTDVKRT